MPNYEKLTHVVFCSVLDPPEVLPGDKVQYVRNESDSFTLQCKAFGIPLPTLYWFSSPPINASSENVFHYNSEMTSIVANAGTNRFANATTFCNSALNSSSDAFVIDSTSFPVASGSSNTTDAVCSEELKNISSPDCSLVGSICSVPCGVVIQDSQSTDSHGGVVSVSSITICNLEKVDELAYTCLAVNNISNPIDTPEAVTANLIVQGI